jgi:hypothetical protein
VTGVDLSEVSLNGSLFNWSVSSVDGKGEAPESAIVNDVRGDTEAKGTNRNGSAGSRDANRQQGVSDGNQFVQSNQAFDGFDPQLTVEGDSLMEVPVGNDGSGYDMGGGDGGYDGGA